MKKYLLVIILFVGFTSFAQEYSKNFDTAEYAKKQTEMIQTALNLEGNVVEQVYKANLHKARSVKKWLLLAEKRGQIAGKTLEQAIKMIEKDAERGSGFLRAMKTILGENLYERYLEKFSTTQ